MRLHRLFSTSSSSTGERAPFLLSNIFGNPNSSSVGSPNTTSTRTGGARESHTANVEGKSVIKEEITPESINIERTFL